MLTTVNTALFYTCLSKYLVWFRHSTPEYASYVSSTINALCLIITESTILDTRMSLFSGYLISDTAYLLSRSDVFSKSNLSFIIHHVLTLLLTTSKYHTLYPNITNQVLLVERTIPLLNAAWFLKNYKNLCNDIEYEKKISVCKNIVQVTHFIAYTYYRVWNLSSVVWEGYKSKVYFPVETLLIFVWGINIAWYKILIKKTIKLVKKNKCISA